ncbi:MAG: hypothetical protein DCF22_00685 [Leptolyngbya sp.]|nr:MAG: hypothetical protein DCF22_00685 [Leptolyngbya sp.]
MTFIRTKMIKGVRYRYEVESYRDRHTGKVRQRVKQYLGKDPLQPANKKVERIKKLGTTKSIVAALNRQCVYGCESWFWDGSRQGYTVPGLEWVIPSERIAKALEQDRRWFVGRVLCCQDCGGGHQGSDRARVKKCQCQKK